MPQLLGSHPGWLDWSECVCVRWSGSRLPALQGRGLSLPNTRVMTLGVRGPAWLVSMLKGCKGGLVPSRGTAGLHAS